MVKNQRCWKYIPFRWIFQNNYSLGISTVALCFHWHCAQSLKSNLNFGLPGFIVRKRYHGCSELKRVISKLFWMLGLSNTQRRRNVLSPQQWSKGCRRAGSSLLHLCEPSSSLHLCTLTASPIVTHNCLACPMNSQPFEKLFVRQTPWLPAAGVRQIQ